MKKIIIMAVILVLVIGAGAYYYFTYVNPEVEEVMAVVTEEVVEEVIPHDYLLYVDDVEIGEYLTFDEALAEVELNEYENAAIVYVYQAGYIWDNYPSYQVSTSTRDSYDFDTYVEAMAYAKTFPRAFVYYRKNYGTLWSNVSELPYAHYIHDIPTLDQNPELPRGCEVTALAMLLNYYDVPISKLALAEEIEKDTTPYEVVDGEIYSGHPNIGFVGSMGDSSAFGYGVYHKPVYNLLKNYLPYSAVDLTGGEFEEILYLVAYDSPVWVMINATYNVLEEDTFQTWKTPYGDVDINYNMHAVLVVGYDNDYIYFNDPLMREEKAPRAEFIRAWEQMGRQAVASTS